jgi:hypothetical protein
MHGSTFVFTCDTVSIQVWRGGALHVYYTATKICRTHLTTKVNKQTTNANGNKPLVQNLVYSIFCYSLTSLDRQ